MVKKYNFHNDRKFIRVTEVFANVVTYINKSNIVIQRDNVESFFIKNDSYIRYFKYQEIQYPETTALEDLLLLLVTMSQSEDNSQVIITNEIEKSDVVFSLNVHSDKDDINFSEFQQGSNIFSTFEKKKVIMGLSNIDPGYSNINVRQSKQYINIPSGKTSISMISATLIHHNTGSSDQANLVTESNHVISRIGLFDDISMITADAQQNFVHGNGIYLEYNSQSNVALYSNVNIVLKKESVMKSIPQADWNIDPLNGRGSSGRTLNVNSAHTYVFKCGNVPNANLSVGLVINGDVIIFHEFDVSNEEYDFFSKLPIRWEITQGNAGGTVIDSPFELHQYNAIVYSNEKYFNSRNAVSTNTKFCEITDIADKCMLFQIRLNSNYIRTNIKLKKINIINVNQDTSMVLWKLIKNGTSHEYKYNPDGTPKYTTDTNITDHSLAIENKSKCEFISYDSKMIEFDDSKTTSIDNYFIIKDGYTITSGYIVGYGQTEIDLSDFSAILNANIQGESDNISLVIEHINSTAEIQACVTWEEYE
jgi:hypothetical protein